MNNREAFEAWMKDKNPFFSLDKFPNGSYKVETVHAANEGYQAALASQAQQESKQGCKECDGQTYIHSPTGEYLGECPFCTKEEEPYAYDVPTDDGTELAYAIYFTKYNNPLPEGAIPLYASQQESQLPDISALKRIAKELKTYIPEADEYKGKFIHKVWAKEIESALPPAPEGE